MSTNFVEEFISSAPSVSDAKKFLQHEKLSGDEFFMVKKYITERNLENGIYSESVDSITVDYDIMMVIDDSSSDEYLIEHYDSDKDLLNDITEYHYLNKKETELVKFAYRFYKSIF